MNFFPWPHMDRFIGIVMFMNLFTWIGIIAGICFLIYYIIKSSNRDAPGKETPLEILKRRYAAGEISYEEYRRMKEELKD